MFVFGEDRWVESHHQGGGPGIFHLMDMSWTMYQLLRWHRDLERRRARALLGPEPTPGHWLATQRPDGGFPAYIDKEGNPVTSVDRGGLVEDLEGRGGDPYVIEMVRRDGVGDRFVESAEDAHLCSFLATLASLFPADDGDCRRSSRRPSTHCDIPDRACRRRSPKWTDFEVYFSCSPKSLDFYDTAPGQWPQNTFCMHHAAAGFLSLYEVTGEMDHLGLAGRVMDRLSLYQQVWSPPWLGLRPSVVTA